MGRKQLTKYFSQQTCDIAHKKTWTWIRKEKLKRESESQLTAEEKKRHKDQLCSSESQ